MGHYFCEGEHLISTTAAFGLNWITIDRLHQITRTFWCHDWCNYCADRSHLSNASSGFGQNSIQFIAYVAVSLQPPLG